VCALSGGSFPLALGVMQILALDLGTDTLSAVALGAEPPAEHQLDGSPVRGRLMNRTVLRRSFGLLGPAEAVLSMATFVACLLLSGWRPGQTFPSGPELLAASGGAFLSVVVAQTANAFACRSSTRRPGELGWTTNRLLLPAVAGALVISLLMLLVPPVSRLLDQAAPPFVGWLLAGLSAPLLLAVDGLDKRLRRHGRGGDGDHRPFAGTTRREMLGAWKPRDPDR
jgi:magnesium-transporting ATPase (P-type)